MIENIKLIGLDENTIEEMYNTLGYDIVLSFACNYETVQKNINLLKSFGVNNIKQLLLNRENIFLMNNEELLKKFSKYNIPSLVNLINNDYTVVDEFL